MTEAEWQNSDSPKRLISWWCPAEPMPPPDCPEVRLLRLIGCACCRRIWRLIFDKRLQRAVEVAERFALGRESAEELCAVCSEGHTALEACEDENEGRSNLWAKLRLAVAKAAVGTSAEDEYLHLLWDVPKEARTAAVLGECLRRRVKSADAVAEFRGRERAAQADIVRDVVGNPFQPVTLEPHWLTPVVVALVQEIEADAAFDLLPILGDALQDAGCENEQLLGHCRRAGPHVPGCWVVGALRPGSSI